LSSDPRLVAAEERVAQDKYDVDAWLLLVSWASRQELPEASHVYERLLEVFPTASRQWKAYLDMAVAERDAALIKSICDRCLLACPDVELWLSYIASQRLMAQALVAQGQVVSEHELLEEAYEFAVKHVGADPYALPLWKGYLQVVQSAPANTPYEENQKIVKARKVFQRAVVQPMIGVEQLWRDYDVFEHKLNKALAKGLLSELQPKHLAAKTVSKERKRLLAGINHELLARPPGPQAEAARDYVQVVLWRRLIAYERSNPQLLEPSALRARVSYTYRQALLTLRHYPEIWREYALFCHETSGAVLSALAADDPERDQAKKVLQEACRAMPYSLLMHLIHADFEEKRKRYAEAKAIYEELVDPNREEQPDSVSPRDPLLWIQYMRFVRRTEGMEPARRVFIRARQAGAVTWQSFVAAAQVEWLQNGQPRVASKLFSYGLREYIGEVEYVVAYLDFLLATGDHGNLRVLFERLFAPNSPIPAEKLEPIWDRFVAFERQCGDLQAMAKAEERRRAALPHIPRNATLDVAERYRCLELWPCSEPLRAFMRKVAELESRPELLQRPQRKRDDTEDAQEGAAAAKPGQPFRVVPRPDVSRMIEFLPGMGDVEPLRTVNVSSLPAALQTLLMLLPTERAYRPAPSDLLDPVALMRVIANATLPSLEEARRMDAEAAASAAAALAAQQGLALTPAAAELLQADLAGDREETRKRKQDEQSLLETLLDDVLEEDLYKKRRQLGKAPRPS